MRRRLLPLSLPVQLLLLASCVKQVSVPAPKPGGYVDAAPTTAHRSVIPVEVRTDIAPLIALVKATAPRPFAKGSQVFNVVDRFIAKVRAQVDYEAYLADAKVTMTGDEVVAAVSVDFRLKVKAKVGGLAGRLNLSRRITGCGYGEPMPRVVFTLRGKLRTLPGPSLRFERTGWKTKWQRPCKLTFNIRLQRILELPIVKGRVQAAIDDALAKAPTKLGLTTRLKSLWNQLDRPHKLTSNAWLVPHPTAIALAPVRGRGTVLTTTLFVRASPEVVFGNRPSVTSKDLPAVFVSTERGSMHVSMTAKVGYEESARQLSTAYRDHPPNDLRIRKVANYGSGGQLVVALTIDRPVRATVYLVGAPEAAAGWVRLSKLRFTKPSRKALVKAIGGERTDRALLQLRRATSIKLSRAHTASRALRDHRLQISSDATTRLELDSQRPGKAWLTPTGISTIVVLSRDDANSR